MINNHIIKENTMKKLLFVLLSVSLFGSGLVVAIGTTSSCARLKTDKQLAESMKKANAEKISDLDKKEKKQKLSKFQEETRSKFQKENEKLEDNIKGFTKKFNEDNCEAILKK